ncbi:hypothetical protein [Streptomyces sp. NPDC058011]|uniref:hypothetical protein n=1 Tax=Streptomyces sp. NPDC058011 TaxID=3346305 RepID=UPI0036E4F300
MKQTRWRAYGSRAAAARDHGIDVAPSVDAGVEVAVEPGAHVDVDHEAVGASVVRLPSVVGMPSGAVDPGSEPGGYDPSSEPAVPGAVRLGVGGCVGVPVGGDGAGDG